MKFSIPSALLSLSAWTLLLCGCDRHPSAAPESGAATAAHAAPGRPLFFYGQPIDEVKKLLGEPNGTISVGNQTVLLYGSKTLKFIDGKWINPQPDIREQLKADQKPDPQPTMFEKLWAKKDKPRAATQPAARPAK